ncbi:MAG: ATP-dependent sacrificial sulfur transferase LarE, partial [Melioribacteraceae bacterium]|nr:ATP-dependent sacrificial sulfur transferase LarE [Melioribacteraceae bacterium]
NIMIEEKSTSILEKLEAEISSYKRVLIALSGGVDSSLAAYLSRKFLGKNNAIAVISNSASLKRNDLEIAKQFCEQYDIKYEIILTNELNDSNYTDNPQNRCYFCKNELYDSLSKLIESKYNGFKIINGNNYSDLGDYRPGLAAAEEQNVFSPFINCKVNKNDIREIARKFELPVWDKPASPCLSSRFPYGEKITIENLRRVEDAETVLNEFGFNEVRVRSYGDTARIEVPSENVMQLKEVFHELSEKILSIGFTNCEIDEEGFISGKMNRALS